MTMTKRTTMRMMYRSMVDIPAVIIISEENIYLRVLRHVLNDQHNKTGLMYQVTGENEGFPSNLRCHC